MKIRYAHGAYVPERMSARPAEPERESLPNLLRAFEPRAVVPNRRDRRRAK